MRCRFCALVLLVLLAVQFASADQLSFERQRAKAMLAVVSNDIAKHYFDEKLNGLDWKALTEQARQKIDKANSVAEMYTSIYALVDKLQDSHTVFVPPLRISRPIFGFNAKAYGDAVRVQWLKPGGAAQKAGLQVGDQLLAVNGFNVERKSWDVMMFFFRVLHPVAKLEVEYSHAGQPSKVVSLDADVKTGKMLRNLTLTTGTDLWDMFREGQRTAPYYFQGSYDGGVQYLFLSEFGRAEFSNITSKLEHAKAVIVDLRGNPGGYETGMLDLIGHFEPTPVVVGKNVSRKKSEDMKSKGNGPHAPADARVIVLIDSESSSAAEIFARHMQRTKRGIIIGDRSSGRVNAAQMFSEHYGDSETEVFYAIEIATARFLFPDGESLEKRGVVPDDVCIPTENDLREGRDPCLLRAFAAARKAAGLTGDVSPTLVTAIDQTRKEIRKYQERVAE